jgi:serine/threonine protein kinase/predicted Zn-dependent protease
MAVKCPKCQTDNPDTQKFCGECATSLKPSKDVSVTKTLKTPTRGFKKNDVIVGKYEIIEKLGQGGMGIVYKAKDTKLKRTVALKFLPPELTRDKEARDRFIQEAQAASALDHPNICTVFEVDEAEDQTFIAMSYIEGQSLKDKLKKGPLAIDEAKDIAIQVADGLQEAHEKGIVHRDIKPANIMLTEKGQAKITDFGLAKLSWGVDLTKTSTIMGTVAYMSPEQARGEEVDHRTDIWSLGAMLYEMMTGERPFKKNQEHALIFEILNEEPATVTTIRPDIPRHIDQVVNKTLEKDSSQRYQMVSEFIQDLAEIPPIFFPKTECSIVVLPFENLSPDPDQEYFCDGMTEELISDLSQVSELSVISRTSAMMLKGTRKSIKTIGKELNIQYVLEGSVRKAGNNIRIVAQLIDAKSDKHIWAKKFSGTLDDVFEIQEKVSRSIVDELKLKLSPEEEQRIAKRPITDIQAYEAYLRARRAIWSFSEEPMERAEEALKSFIKKIGDNEQLYATLGFIYVMYISTGLKPDKFVYNLRKAEEYAKKTFDLNPHSPHGHGLIGLTHFFKGNIQEAVRHFKQALAADPNNPDTLLFCSYGYLMSGKGTAARPLIEKALEIDPLQPLFQCMPGFLDVMEGRFEAAIPYYRKMSEMDPENQTTQLFYAWILSLCNRKDEAYTIIDFLVKTNSKTPAAHMSAFLKHALSGNKERALKSVTKEIVSASKDVEFFSRFMADCYALIGEKEEAMNWIENDMRLGFVNYPYLSEYDPHLKNIRNEEQFKKIMEQAKDRWEHFEV